MVNQFLTIKIHMKQKLKIAMYNIQRIKHIWHMLTEDDCKTLVHGLVISHLDYSNALFIGLPDCSLNKLQVQNIAAKHILDRSKMDSPNETMYHLHWFPVWQRIHHKIATLTFKCLIGEALQSLRYMTVLHHQNRPGVCSDDRYKRLQECRTLRKTFTDWSFKIAAPRLWNRLLNDGKSSLTLDTFKRSLKRYLFRQVF